MPLRFDKLLFRLLLGNYRRQGALVYQKARVQLGLLVLTTSVLAVFIIMDFILDRDINLTLVVPMTAGIALMAVLIVILKAGFYLLSGHGFLLLTFALIWQDMFWGTAVSPVTRLDTMVLLLCSLLMVPLLTDVRGLMVHFALNLGIFTLFMLENPEAGNLRAYELRAYGTDALIAICMTGIVSALLSRINKRARRRIERDHASLEETAGLRTRALREATEGLQKSRDEMHLDLDMARQVQRNMVLTAPPAVTGWDIALVARPSAQVSGDFYDFYTDDDRLAGLSIFDVSGHGVASGLITILARSTVHRSFRDERHGSTGEILEHANRELIEELSNVSNFLSGIVIRVMDGAIEYSSAGHPEPLLSRPDFTGPVAKLARTPEQQEGFVPRRGNLLGLEVLEDRYPVARVPVFPGDALLLFTDGIVEATNEDREEYGTERLTAALRSSAGGTGTNAAERLRAVLSDFDAFMGSLPCDDDLTLLLLIKS